MQGFNRTGHRVSCCRFRAVIFLLSRRASLAFFLASLVLCLFQGPARGVGQEFVPLDSWVYEAVERFEALGFCVVPADLPLTRPEFIELTSLISKNAWDSRLTARDRYLMRKLEKEFTDFASQRDPQARYDPPTFYLEERPMVFEGDVDCTSWAANEFFSDENEFFAASSPRIKLHLLDRVTYDVHYRLVLGPEHGDRARNQRPSRRERSFKGLTSLYDRSYLIAGWDKIHFYLGREHVDWGPSDWGNLIVPGARLSLDQIGARAKLKNMRLSVFHAQLSPHVPRYLAGHRLEIRFGRTVIGISETVIYGRKQFDPVYALPLSSFYANQFNERGDDNVIWSLDVKTCLFDAVTLYGGFLTDDFQFERDGVNPDKLAFDVGGRMALSYPVAATFRARYRFVDIYTFTHKDSITAYVSGEGILSEGDVLLGGEPGPDADHWRIEGEFYPRHDLIATAAVFSERRGQGNDFRPHVKPADPAPLFPLGIVQRTAGWAVKLQWELRRNSKVTGYYSRVTVHNKGNVPDLDADGESFRLEVSWDFL